MDISNKRIVKNTLLLYFRMLLTMLVSLYTVRVVLETLGVEDYGIYNVVGGIVTSFAFLSSTMASATQRFFAFELGRKDHTKLRKVFSTSILIYVVIALIILILAETLGLWFLNERLVIPSGRLYAANWVYQFSIASFIITIVTIPLDAIIMARENMKFYAYISFLEVILKLVVVYLLLLYQVDKLIFYGILIFFVTLIVKSIYYFYCNKRFEETKFIPVWDKALFKEILSYSGWNLFGTLTAVSFNQGVSFLLNIFFGPTVNASRALAAQMNSVLGSFSNNFYSAVRPQIIKSYAEDNTIRTMSLVFNSTKYSFFLLMLLSMPILLDTNFILQLWLKKVPEHAATFAQLTIVFTLVNMLQIPLTTAVQATGKIKNYQFVVGIIMLMCLPLSYLALKVGYPPESAFVLMILVSLIALVFRLIILKKLIYFKYTDYLLKVLFKISIVSFVSYGISYLFKLYFFDFLSINDFVKFILECIFILGFAAIIIYFLGLAQIEKQVCLNYLKNFLDKFFKRKSSPR